MSKRRLTVDTPCDNRWQDLEPREGGRYCPQCDKVVVDLMRATADEAWARFDAADGELCVRIRPDMEGDAIFKRPPRPPASARFAAIAAGALLAACEPGAEPDPDLTPVVEVEPEIEPPAVEEPAVEEPVVEEPVVAEVDEPAPEEGTLEEPAPDEHPAHPGEAHTALHHRDYGRMGGARARPIHPRGTDADRALDDVLDGL